MRILSLGASGPKDIYSLPDDILLLIISYISVKDIITLRKSSKKFYELTKMRWVWSDAVKRHVIDKGLPVPAASTGIKAFSSQHLESRAVHAAKFNDNWYSAQPKPRGAIEFQVNIFQPDGSPYAVRQVVFLKGRCGEFLLTLAWNTIECWEIPLDGSGAYRIAEWTDEQGIEQILVNDDPKHAAEVAYLAVSDVDPEYTWVYTLSLDTFHGAFKARSAMRGLRDQMYPLHLMHGDFVVMGDPFLVWNSKGPGGSWSIARLMNDAHVVILTAKVVEHYLIVVRTRCIEAYVFPVWSAKEHRFSCVGYIISALAMDAQPVREAAIIVRPKAELEPSTSAYPSTPPPVTILMLQSTHFLTQLDLLPSRSPKKQGPNSPYELPTTATRIYQVAPSSCQLKLSSGGKGIWMQTHNVTNRRAAYPARCIMGFDVSSPHQSYNATGSEDASSLHICQSELYARRCDMSEILRKKYSIVAADLEDSVGRIAVGDRLGRIEVLDYV
ncbi:hypothetical protein BC835DRAFT_1285891 [Cytidiella melzeri]|nr:hypothetical protein BC835DRAFT_1285891 [Cytidiella melzeri]